MSSDKRWTGGIANRGWQSGTTAEPVVDVEAITRAVGEYVADCRTLRRTPTERGCLKAVFHAGAGQKKAVIAAFREATGHG